MATLILILALLGAFALISRLLRSLLRVGLRSAEVAAAGGLVEISARRGDLTEMAERRAAEQAARRLRRRDLGLALLWTLWLVVPAFAGWKGEAYALAAPLWLLPKPALRPRP